jgi:hypothetical protein
MSDVLMRIDGHEHRVPQHLVHVIERLMRQRAGARKDRDELRRRSKQLRYRVAREGESDVAAW